MRAVIFANGDASDPNSVRHWTAQADLIIAADGGTRHALSAGVMPQVVIGDLDSLADTDREQLDRSGVQLIVYPTHKDYTDLELAVRYARGQQATEIIIFSALGGRWDQSLANVMLLAAPELAQVPVRLVDHALSIQVIRDRAEIAGRVGDTLSLIALTGDAHGVTIEGCEYPLNNAALPLGATLGISNVFAQPTAKITVRQGLVLALHTRREE
jgi:thiamine pyrophosphokinase